MSDEHPSAGARRQAVLFERLACPECRGRLSVLDGIVRHHAIVTGSLQCSTHGTVGIVNAYKPGFLDRDLADPANLAGVVPQWRPIELSTLASSGAWSAVPEGLLATGAGAELGGLVTGVGVRIELMTHAWSGRVVVRFDDEVRTVDLWSAEPGTEVVTVLSTGETAERAWSISLLDGGTSGIEQVVVRALYSLVRPVDAEPPENDPVNRGNPYPPRFGEILSSLPDSAVVLDLGGGDRRYPDERVFNLEYLPYRSVDLYADGLRLPFADDSFDFVMSQAVLEHVPDPKLAVAEIERILKPGGIVYAEFAFMQPLHAVPYHFFNITPHGAALLFGHWDDVRIGSFGGLAETVGWFFRLVHATDKIGEASVQAIVRGLADLDSSLSPHELSMLSSAVQVEARSPQRS